MVPPEVALKRGKQFLLAYVGVMGSQDGVEYAINAMAELVYKRKHTDVLLVLMGDGEQLLSLKRSRTACNSPIMSTSPVG